MSICLCVQRSHGIMHLHHCPCVKRDWLYTLYLAIVNHVLHTRVWLNIGKTLSRWDISIDRKIPMSHTLVFVLSTSLGIPVPKEPPAWTPPWRRVCSPPKPFPSVLSSWYTTLPLHEAPSISTTYEHFTTPKLSISSSSHDGELRLFSSFGHAYSDQPSIGRFVDWEPSFRVQGGFLSLCKLFPFMSRFFYISNTSNCLVYIG